MTGVVVALPAEARLLGARRVGAAGGLLLEGGASVTVAGMGRSAAAAAAQALAQAGATGLACVGFAGGLDPNLAAGSLLIATDVRRPAGERFATSAVWRNALAQRLEPRCAVLLAPLLTVDEPLASVADKRRAHAASGAAAVDMESAAVAEVAARLGLPFIALRVIVDAASDALPAAVVAASRAGRLRLGRLAWGLVTAPAEVAGLARLVRRYAAARAGFAALRRAGLVPAPCAHDGRERVA